MSSPKDILATEDSPKFHKRMGDAMVVSFHKYGPVREGYPHAVSAIRSLKHRLKLYEDTGNADYLVDVANFAMIEFMCPDHNKYHDKPTDGGEGRCWHNGPRRETKNNGERL